jgi:tetratricopeptide (TPR) repeat protein
MKNIKRGTYTEDEFQSTMRKIMKYIVRHRETSIWIGIGVVAVIVVAMYFLSSGEAQNPEADLLHTQVMAYMTTGRIQETENVLLELTQKFANTRPGKIGFYYLGVLYYNTGRFEEALDVFDEFLRRQKNDYLLTPSALYGAGCAAEGLKDYERARTYYEKIIKDKNSNFYQLGLLAYGRVCGIMGDTETAREVLENLLAQNPVPDIAADAQFYLGYFSE